MKTIDVNIPEKPRQTTKNVAARLTIDEYIRFNTFCRENNISKSAMTRSLVTSLLSAI